MKILFITNIQNNSKGGLFISVAYRTSSILKNYNIDGKVISLIDKETKFCKIIKKTINKNVCNVNIKGFFFRNTFCEYVFNKVNLIDVLLSKLFIKTKLKKSFRTLEKHVKLYNYNLIQAHWAYPIGYIAKMIKDKYGIPYVLTVHGSDIHTKPFENSNVKKYTLEALENADKVIFVSKKLLNIAKGIGYSGENAIIIPNGIDTEMFIPIEKGKIKKELGFINKKVVGFIGNLVEVKRADKLPEIFDNINKIDRNIEFLVVGEGILKENIIKKCKDKDINVRFTGRVNPENVYRYINAIDVLILPSRNEGFGCVVLEANACGIPVVGSSNGGIPEAIGKYGIVVDEGAGFEVRFARATIDCLNNKYDSDELRERTLQYDWGKISLEEFDVYKSIINDNKERVD